MKKLRKMAKKEMAKIDKRVDKAKMTAAAAAAVAANARGKTQIKQELSVTLPDKPIRADTSLNEAELERRGKSVVAVRDTEASPLFEESKMSMNEAPIPHDVAPAETQSAARSTSTVLRASLEAELAKAEAEQFARQGLSPSEIFDVTANPVEGPEAAACSATRNSLELPSENTPQQSEVLDAETEQASRMLALMGDPWEQNQFTDNTNVEKAERKLVYL